MYVIYIDICWNVLFVWSMIVLCIKAFKSNLLCLSLISLIITHIQIFADYLDNVFARSFLNSSRFQFAHNVRWNWPSVPAYVIYTRSHALSHTRIWDPLVNLRQLLGCCDRLKSLSLRVDPCARIIRNEWFHHRTLRIVNREKDAHKEIRKILLMPQIWINKITIENILPRVDTTNAKLNMV